jgi:hypothetical protein
MKGYLSFVLASVSLALILSLLSLLAASKPGSLADAISVERTYGVQMNAKECIIGTVRQWGQKGFGEYALHHSVESCRFCPDHFCTPWSPPAPSPGNPCIPQLCSACFRESEARAFSENAVSIGLGSIPQDAFDPEYLVVLSHGPPEAFLSPDPAKPGGFHLDSIRFRQDILVHAESLKLGAESDASLPSGMVVRCG